MTNNENIQVAWRRRASERMSYETSMELILIDGRRFEGISVDVSLSGLLLKMDIAGITDVLGLSAELRLVPDRQALRVPCRVMRMDEQGLGIAFEGTQPAFGMLVTHDLMLDMLGGVSKAFSATLDQEETLKTAVAQIKNYMFAEAASLFMLEDDGQEVVCVSCAGPVDVTGLRLSATEGIVGRCIREGAAVIVDDVQSDTDFAVQVDEATGFVTQSIVCMPLKIGDRTLGAFEVMNKRDSDVFEGQDATVLSALAATSALAIHNARQSAKLVEQEQYLNDRLEFDLSERTAELQKAKDEAEDVAKLKDKFVSLVAHDLRGPLGAMVGMLDMTLQFGGEITDDDRERLTMVADQGRSLGEIVGGLLDISRFQTGKITPEYGFIDARFVAEGAIDKLTTIAQGKGVEIVNAITEKTRVYADELLLTQVIQNLVSNAIKFSNTGDRIEITFDGEAGDGNIILAVRDDGVGIPTDRIPNLFRLDEKTSTIGTGGEAGTGFGLPLSREIVLAHGGDLLVDSVPDQGSTFSVQLPAVRPRVLIVDDELIIRRILERTIEPLDVDVVMADSGAAALEALADQADGIHLILSDINMPRMSGLELLEQIKADPLTKAIPVIVITADDDVETRDRAFRLGAVDFTVKPVVPNDLLPRMRHILG